MYWMNYRGAQRLAVLQDETPESKDLARKAIGAVDEVPKLVSLQTVEPGGQDLETIAKAAIAAKPNFVLWTGGAGRRRRSSSRRCATPATRARSPPPRRPRIRRSSPPPGAAGEGAFVTATATPLNTPTAEPWSARLRAALQAQAGLRGPAGLRRRADARARDRTGPAAPRAARSSRRMTTLDAEVRQRARRRAVRRRPHAALRQPRHPEGEGRSLHLGAVAAHGFAGVTRAAALLAALALALGAPAALADGDPASDVLISERVFYPYEVKLPRAGHGGAGGRRSAARPIRASASGSR